MDLDEKKTTYKNKLSIIQVPVPSIINVQCCLLVQTSESEPPNRCRFNPLGMNLNPVVNLSRRKLTIFA